MKIRFAARDKLWQLGQLRSPQSSLCLSNSELCSALSQFPERCPSCFTPFTRLIPAASSGLNIRRRRLCVRGVEPQPAPVWGFGSAKPLLKSMGDACVLRTTFPVAQAFASPYPSKPKHMNDRDEPKPVRNQRFAIQSSEPQRNCRLLHILCKESRRARALAERFPKHSLVEPAPVSYRRESP
jgi:hypothetical protein